MVFTKDELEQQLRKFMVGLACSMERVYGTDRAGALLGHPDRGAEDVEPQEAKLEDSWFFRAVMEMYDYGILGKPHPSFGADGDVGNHYGEAEMFLLGIEGLELFLEEDDVRIPKLARRTVLTAMARHLLDGGERYITREDDETAGYLSFAEVALLANMDERSVRNAANPKLPDALVTKNFGRRSMIAIADARRWLAGRKGFTPTQGQEVKTAEQPVQELVPVEMPYDVKQRLNYFAEKAGLDYFSRWKLVSNLLDQYEQQLADGSSKDISEGSAL